MAAPDPAAEPPTPTGLAHVATVSFLAARAAPSMQFWIALAGGIALARTAALRGLRIGLRREPASMLQTVAVMGPARVNGPLTQALTAPLLGALHRRGTPVALQIAACFAIRLSHYVVLTAVLVWIVLGGLDAYAGSYDTLTGWLGLLPEGERGALIVTAVLNVGLAAFYSVTQVLVYRWALGSWPADAARDRRARGRAGAGSRLGALRPARDHAGGRGRVRAAAERHVVGAAGERRRLARDRMGGVAVRPRGARARARADRAAGLRGDRRHADRRAGHRRGAAAGHSRRAARARRDLDARGRRAGRPARDVPARALARPRGAAGARGERASSTAWTPAAG